MTQADVITSFLSFLTQETESSRQVREMAERLRELNEQEVYEALTSAYWARRPTMGMALDACEARDAEPTTERLDAVCTIIDRNLLAPNFNRMAKEVAEEIERAA